MRFTWRRWPPSRKACGSCWGAAGSLRAAVRGTISHQLRWIERHQDRARFLYTRGHLDWDSPAGAELVELNRSLASAYRDWMAPLVDSGEIRQMSMLMLTAIVNGPAHAIARRWLAGHVSSPLQAHLEELADAATAALSGAPSRPRPKRSSLSQRGLIRLELLADDGSVLAGGQATAELLDFRGGQRMSAAALVQRVGDVHGRVHDGRQVMDATSSAPESQLGASGSRGFGCCHDWAPAPSWRAASGARLR